MAKVNIENVKTVNSTGFNMEKTNELIQDLKDQGLVVDIEDLAGYLRKQGLIVKEHIGRKRNYVEVSPKLFGIDVNQKGDDVKELMKEHIKMGKMSFIPDSYEKKLHNLEQATRMARRRACIGYEDSFMPIETYKTFNREFEERKTEYFKLRDEIVLQWDNLLSRFKEILKSSLEELNTIDKESTFATVVAKLPSKEEYKESFYMSLSAKAFPVTENLDMFEESIQDQIKNGLNQDTISTLYEIIGNTLNDAFENVSKILLSLQKNDKVSHKTIESLQKSAVRVAEKNIFHNPKIEEVRLEILEVLASSHEIDTMWEKAENLLATIYGYAKELHIENSIKMTDSPLSSDELLAIYSMLETVSESNEIPA
ncbi:hypothetical protein ACFVS2_21455 [Brevibacillus sp. NPDC058079]|uniref:hypothetical protein n=1 Tax=Brevibacillus sp. NPDC058079 TaxID=3346330 RepID=UPI0036E78D3B